MTSKKQDIHISAINTFQILQRDIIKPNGELNIPVLLYILAIPITLIGIISYIQTAMSYLKDPKLFKTHDLWFTLTMFLLMIVKIPYFFDKPIALLQFILFSLLWSIAAVILIIVYIESR